MTDKDIDKKIMIAFEAKDNSLFLYILKASTPPVFLAATCGYHMVVEVFKQFFDTNFLIENNFQQTILHMVPKAGYDNKVLSKSQNPKFSKY
jgi:hypothetical protein